MDRPELILGDAVGAAEVVSGGLCFSVVAGVLQLFEYLVDLVLREQTAHVSVSVDSGYDIRKGKSKVKGKSQKSKVFRVVRGCALQRGKALRSDRLLTFAF